jgi:hypothetical protein
VSLRHHAVEAFVAQALPAVLATHNVLHFNRGPALKAENGRRAA